MATILHYSRSTVSGNSDLHTVSPSTRMILSEAKKLGITWKLLPHTKLFELSHNGRIVHFHHQIPSQTTSIAEYSCRNKQITHNLLKNAGVSVNDGYYLCDIDSDTDLLTAFSALHKPVVVKPADSSRGKAVFLHVLSKRAFLSAVRNIRSLEDDAKILVEQQFTAAEYRVLCTRDEVVSVIKRVPPNVIGDGFSTIAQLAARKSELHLKHRSGVLKELVIDAKTIAYLAQHGMSPEYIPVTQEIVYLQQDTLFAIDRGGDTVEVSEELDDSIRIIALQAIRAIPGLSWAGIDLLCLDHTAPQSSDSYRVIEINASPSLDWQQYPLYGVAKNVTKAFLTVLFPELDGKKSRKLLQA